MQEKLYRFVFDKQTGLYKGLTYEQPWAENTTVLQPHFEAGFKTVFDFEFSAWKLVPQEIFFKQMSCIDRIGNVVEFKNNVVRVLFQRLNENIEEKFVDTCKLVKLCHEKNDLKFHQMYLENRLNYSDLKKEILLLSCDLGSTNRHLGYLEDLLIDIRDAQKDHYLYSRKSYWTSRFIDSVTKFAMCSRDIFFKFFNS